MTAAQLKKQLSDLKISVNEMKSFLKHERRIQRVTVHPNSNACLMTLSGIQLKDIQVDDGIQIKVENFFKNVSAYIACPGCGSKEFSPQIKGWLSQYGFTTEDFKGWMNRLSKSKQSFETPIKPLGKTPELESAAT